MSAVAKQLDVLNARGTLLNGCISQLSMSVSCVDFCTFDAANCLVFTKRERRTMESS